MSNFMFPVCKNINIYWGYEFEKWNCNRAGMDFDYFVDGCVVRKK